MTPTFFSSRFVLAPVLFVLAACGSSTTGLGPGGGNGGGNGGGGSGDDGGQGGTLGGGGSDSGMPTTCMTDSDCNSGKPCLTGKCTKGTGGGEFNEGQCTYTPVSACDAGTGASPDGGLPPIDMACMNAPMCNSGLASVYPPYVPLYPPDVPPACSNGFELGDADTCGGGPVSYVIHAKPGGSRAIQLDVDFATYLEPDGVLVTGVDGQGSTYTLLDTCRIQTWTAADPTGGLTRPPDATIRQFHLDLKQGTTQLTFDFGGVVSPMYLQVLGLCDFDLTPFAQVKSYKAVP